MAGATLLIITIISGMALAQDFNSSVKLLTSIIAILGVTFLVKKIFETGDYKKAEIVQFTGRCLAAIPFLSLLKLSIAFLHSDTVNKFGLFFQKISQIADRITFWN